MRMSGNEGRRNENGHERRIWRGCADARTGAGSAGRCRVRNNSASAGWGGTQHERSDQTRGGGSGTGSVRSKPAGAGPPIQSPGSFANTGASAKWIASTNFAAALCSDAGD